MMSSYCFAERPRELFVESVTRGWLAAVLDFPHLKTHTEAQAAAQRVPYDLAPEVCCIPADDYPYRLLVVHAWVSSYRLTATMTSERLFAQAAFHLKGLPEGEALAVTRPGMAAEPEIQEDIERVYTHYLSMTRST